MVYTPRMDPVRGRGVGDIMHMTYQVEHIQVVTRSVRGCATATCL